MLIFLASCNQKFKSSVIVPPVPINKKAPDYSIFRDLGIITTKTKDIEKYIVKIDIIILYDLDDLKTKTELETKKIELSDCISLYFTGKYFSEFYYENESNFRNELMEIMNKVILENGKIKSILFDKLDVIDEGGKKIYK
jgi:flagellar basal body-associated protein FliL